MALRMTGFQFKHLRCQQTAVLYVRSMYGFVSGDSASRWGKAASHGLQQVSFAVWLFFRPYSQVHPGSWLRVLQSVTSGVASTYKFRTSRRHRRRRILAARSSFYFYFLFVFFLVKNRNHYETNLVNFPHHILLRQPQCPNLSQWYLQPPLSPSITKQSEANKILYSSESSPMHLHLQHRDRPARTAGTHATLLASLPPAHLVEDFLPSRKLPVPVAKVSAWGIPPMTALSTSTRGNYCPY